MEEINGDWATLHLQVKVQHVPYGLSKHGWLKKSLNQCRSQLDHRVAERAMFVCEKPSGCTYVFRAAFFAPHDGRMSRSQLSSSAKVSHLASYYFWGLNLKPPSESHRCCCCYPVSSLHTQLVWSNRRFKRDYRPATLLFDTLSLLYVLAEH